MWISTIRSIIGRGGGGRGGRRRRRGGRGGRVRVRVRRVR